MNVGVVHGPNLRLLGKREPDVYGTQTLEDVDRALATLAKELGVELETLQSNHEGELLDFVETSIHIEGGKFHLAGCSNGGNIAFDMASSLAGRFHSLTVFPGNPRSGEKFDRYRGTRVRMHVGSEDTGWLRSARRPGRWRSIRGTRRVTTSAV